MRKFLWKNFLYGRTVFLLSESFCSDSAAYAEFSPLRVESFVMLTESFKMMWESRVWRFCAFHTVRGVFLVLVWFFPLISVFSVWSLTFFSCILSSFPSADSKYLMYYSCVSARILITFLSSWISCTSSSCSSSYISPSVLARARLAPVAAFSDILWLCVALLFSVLYYALYRCIFESLVLLCVDMLSVKSLSEKNWKNFTKICM